MSVWLFLFCHERDEGQLWNEDCVTSMDANRWRSLLVVDGCVGLEKDVLHSSDDVVVGMFVCWCGL